MGPRFRGDDRLWLGLDARAGEIRPGLGRDARAELRAQGARLHLLDRARRELAELERPERHPDQAVDREPEVAEHVPHHAVLALADRKGKPDIAALDAIDRGLHRTVAD